MTGRRIAVVSGKGGSGKTMIAVEMAYQFVSSTGDSDKRIVIMDTDIGTAGMSYYLGLKKVRNIRTGFSTVALGRNGYPGEQRLSDLLQPVLPAQEDSFGDSRFNFLPIGDHRRINREYQRALPASGEEMQLGVLIEQAILDLAENCDALIADCRGGIDDESLAVCGAVDDIILIVEPDTTSFQASRHLVDVLADVDLVHKLRGFIINKVYSNPEAVIRNGASDFGSQFLAAIPFDLSATRAFLVGDVPGSSSIMSLHVREALSRAYPDLVTAPRYGTWKPRDYEMTNVFTPAASRTGVMLALLLLTFGIAFGLVILSHQATESLTFLATAILSVLGAAAAALVPLRMFTRKRPGRSY
jgi:septum site-determining protein MinD